MVGGIALVSLLFAGAQPVSAVDLARSSGEEAIGPTMEVFAEPAATPLALDDAWTSRAFRPSTLREPNFGLEGRVLWARFTTSGGDGTWVLRAGFPRPHHLDEWDRFDDGRVVHKETAALDGGVSDIVVPVDVHAREHLVRVDARPARLNLVLLNDDGLLGARAREMLFAGLYLGIFFGLFLYNLFLGASLKDGVQILYCAFLVSIASQVAVRDGTFPPGGPAFLFAGGGGMALCSIITLVFARRFLSTRARLPRLDIALRLHMLVCAVLVIASLLGATLAGASAALSALGIVLVVAAAVLAARAGDRPARWFLVAWSVLVASSLWLVLHAFGVVDASWFTDQGMRVGSALEMILLSLALASRVRALRGEKEDAVRTLLSARANANAELAGHVIEAQEKERARFARDLHDGIGHTLLDIQSRLTVAVRDNAPIAVADAKQLTSDAQACLDDARAMARNLVPPTLRGLGIVEALRAVVDEIAARGALVARFTATNVDGIDAALGDRAIHLVRIAQEASTNAFRHAQGKTLDVRLIGGNGTVSLEIADDGVGVAPAVTGAVRGIGLLAMEQRARLVGGTLAVISAPGAGTRVVCRAPFTPVASAPVVLSPVTRDDLAEAAE